MSDKIIGAIGRVSFMEVITEDGNHHAVSISSYKACRDDNPTLSKCIKMPQFQGNVLDYNRQNLKDS